MLLLRRCAVANFIAQLDPRNLRRIYIAALVGLWASGCSEGRTDAVLATVLAVDGTCTAREFGARESAPLVSGIALRPSTILTTGVKGHVALALLPNVRIELTQNSELKIIRLTLKKDGNETGRAMRDRHVEVKLLQGSVVIAQVLRDWAKSRVYVETSNGILVGDYESIFRIEHTDDITRAVCVRGIVEFHPNGSPVAVTLSPGTAGEWGHGQARIFPAETDSRAQLELEEAVAGEARLRKLRSPAEKFPPP